MISRSMGTVLNLLPVALVVLAIVTFRTQMIIQSPLLTITQLQGKDTALKSEMKMQTDALIIGFMQASGLIGKPIF